jgi:diadenylate cyclase
MKDERLRETEFLNTLKVLAPGTPLREGLDNVINARTGGLIVIDDGDKVLKLVEGGFYINMDYSPSCLYELAKMDGAIIISSDLKKILYANTQLIPDPSINTQETGTRHRTADRAAKQTGAIVISISQRRNVITVYKGCTKYVLKDTSIILTKANQAVQTLEKYKSILDQTMNNLTSLEFDDLATLYDVSAALQRMEMVLRVVREVEKYICELGNEGRLISMQLSELVSNVEEEGVNLIKDYHISADGRDHDESRQNISGMTDEELLVLLSICKALGYPGDINVLDEFISPRGYRVLSKIPRLPISIIDNLVKTLGNFRSILQSSTDELDSVEGIGEVRARAVKDGLRRIKEQLLFERHI